MKSIIPKKNEDIYLLLTISTTPDGIPLSDYQFIKKSEIAKWIERAKTEQIIITILKIKKAQILFKNLNYTSKWRYSIFKTQ